MGQGWKDYEDAAERGPVSLVLKVFFGFLLVSVVVGGVGYACGWLGEAAEVAREEFGPREALKKYEQFKEMSAQLDAKRANIEVLERELATVKTDYGNAPQVQWPRDAREDYNNRRSALYGLKASFNNLAADYNAQMAKFNWRFANRGELPPGADKPLPREYKPYVTE